MHSNRLLGALGQLDLTDFTATMSHSTLTFRADGLSPRSDGAEVELEPTFHNDDTILRFVVLSTDSRGMLFRIIEESIWRPVDLDGAIGNALDRLKEYHRPVQ